VSRQKFAHNLSAGRRENNKGNQKEDEGRFITVEHRASRKAKIQWNIGILWIEIRQFLTRKRKRNQKGESVEYPGRNWQSERPSDDVIRKIVQIFLEKVI
jgi:hypothetical protein